jgi:hypothetical protein
LNQSYSQFIGVKTISWNGITSSKYSTIFDDRDTKRGMVFFRGIYAGTEVELYVYFSLISITESAKTKEEIPWMK